MTSAPKRARSTLLSHIPASYTSTATVFPRSTRTLQIRANVLIINRRCGASHRLIPLSTQTLYHREKAVIIDGVKLSFASKQHAKQFIHAVETSRRTSPHQYKIIEQIGHGATGTVFHAKRLADDMSFALKRIPKHEAFYSDSHLENTVSEYLTLSTVSSPFLLHLVDAYETEHHLNLVTPLAAHGDLVSLLKRAPGGKLQPHVARYLFAEIVSGLEDLHRAGYLYRDLKLANILLTSNGHIKLADFGLAKKLRVETSDIDDSDFKLVGRAKSFVGTRRYMSPEHLTSSHASNAGYGAPSDLWALGVSLYLLLTGKYPFASGVSGGNSGAIFQAIKHEQLQFPEHVSEQARDLITALLERKASERITLKEVKAHPWLAGIDWTKLREEADLAKPVSPCVRLAEGERQSESEHVVELSTLYRDIDLLGFGAL